MLEDNCIINRWDLLKQQLNNLAFPEFLIRYRQTPGACLLDVRQEPEFEQHHLEGAVNVDFLGPDFIDQLDAFDRNKTYFVYCRSGRRSLRTCVLMVNSGFPAVFNLDGGLNTAGL